MLGAAFALIAIFQVVRMASVELGGGSSPLAQRLWADSPDVLAARIMVDVAGAAVRGAQPDDQVLDQVSLLAARQPLSAEPYLVQGAIASRQGDYLRAEKLLTSARLRAPRSPAARYLLSDLYLRTDRPAKAMAEMAVLNRLLPAASSQLAPAMAAYARAPGSLPQLKAILSSYPELRDPVLTLLSGDVANTEIILQLIAGGASHASAPPYWQRQLLTKLVVAGQYDRAYAIWGRLSGVQARSGSLYNPQFEDSFAPPPFNWELAQGSGGVAESGSGGLQVVFFGREDAILASQTLLLPPGRYRLSTKAAGEFPQHGLVSWKIRCLPAERELGRFELRSGEIGGDFIVPAEGCGAQNVILSGQAGEFAERAEFRIAGLTLSKVPN